jgi:hypothetical protein
MYEQLFLLFSVEKVFGWITKEGQDHCVYLEKRRLVIGYINQESYGW